MVYLQDQTTWTPSLANPPVPIMPPETRFTTLLHVILPVSRTRYVYIYGYISDPCISFDVAITTTATITPPRYDPAHQICRCEPVIGISSFFGRRFDSIRLTIFDLIRLTCGFDLIRLNWFFSLFDSIRLTCSIFIFVPSHTI